MEATLMNRSLLSALVLTSLGCLTACGAENDPASLGDDVSVAEQALGDQSPWSAHMAALGDLTLRCWGTVGPNTYTTKNGWLQPTRRGCVRLPGQNPEDPEAVWRLLEGNLGIQFLEVTPENPNAEKDAREARSYMLNTWNTWLATSPPPQSQCPRWEYLGSDQDPVADPDYFRSLPRAPKDSEVKEFNAFGKTLPVYHIETRCNEKTNLRCVDPCQGNPKCAVSLAKKCGGGFGYPFLHKADAIAGTWQVDPLYWEETRVEYDPSNNPFMDDDYFHGMSFWGPSPGAVYGAVPREWEPCSVKSGASHIVTYLKAVTCTSSPVDGSPTPGWICLSQCRL
jgi:hypothetical protein